MPHFVCYYALGVGIGVVLGLSLASWRKHVRLVERDRVMREHMKQRIWHDVIQREPVSQ